MHTLAATPAGPRQAPGFWMEDAGEAPAHPVLESSLAVDVAVVGGGFTGLWTAYELLLREPSLRVAILERDRVGFGASGRNGSWCVPELNVGPRRLAEKFGKGRALDLYRAMCETTEAIGRTCEQEGIDARFQQAGMLLVARGRQQIPALRSAYREYRDSGLGDHHRWLGRQETQALVAVNGAEHGIYTPDGATLHPGRLVLGLAEVVRRRGAEIYEGTSVTGVIPGRRPRVLTPRGEVAAKAVVLALEAYLCELPGYHRRVLPIYSLIDLTEPLTQEQLAQIHWNRRICLASMRLTVDYLALTSDRRVVVGGRGAPYRFGSGIDRRTEVHPATHSGLRAMFYEWFPQLAGVRFTHSWGGVLGMPRDWIPRVSYSPRTGVGLSYGYTGHGVATARLAGAALADLISERRSALTELPIINRQDRGWEPEPLRWLGVRYVQGQLARLDARGERGGRPPSGRTIAERLAAH
ncbi:MAG: NAD(P)/FAD-dependent oxidoreductase [Candidatus Dormibacteria bacterium]